MGGKYDAYYQIDASGIAFSGGGLSANLLDLTKFGEMIRNKGYFNGKQIIPVKVVEDIFAGGSKKAFAKAGYKTLEGWSYKTCGGYRTTKMGNKRQRCVWTSHIYILIPHQKW